jgi:hypothetical protein
MPLTHHTNYTAFPFTMPSILSTNKFFLILTTKKLGNFQVPTCPIPASLPICNPIMPT